MEQLLREFENHGLVNVKLLEHTVKRGDEGSIVIQADGKICFALDAPKERKKQKAPTITFVKTIGLTSCFLPGHYWQCLDLWIQDGFGQNPDSEEFDFGLAFEAF